MARHLLALCIALCLLPAARAATEIETLQQQLLARDALIRDLLRRVEALEQRSAASPPAAAATQRATAQASVANPAPEADANQEDETARALERALVREGGFVLAARSVEVEPRFQTIYTGSRGLAIVQTPAGPQVTESSSRRYRNEAGLGLRIGLPHASQISLRLPYVDIRGRTSAPAVALDDSPRSAGLGDVEVQFTKQLTNERGAWPALLGSVAWKPASGVYEPGRASPGVGFASVQVALTAVKRQDPLVFFGTLSSTSFRRRDEGRDSIAPGAGVGLRFGTLLAASPETSLRAGLDLSRTSRTRINGVATPASQTLSGIMEFGLSSLVSRTTSLDLNVGFGVTPDAPKLRIGVSLPIRWN